MRAMIPGALLALSVSSAQSDGLGYERGQIENAGQALAIGRLCHTERSIENAGMFKANAAQYARLSRYQIDVAVEKVAKKFAAKMKRKPKELAQWCDIERLPPSPYDELGD